MRALDKVFISFICMGIVLVFWLKNIGIIFEVIKDSHETNIR